MSDDSPSVGTQEVGERNPRDSRSAAALSSRTRTGLVEEGVARASSAPTDRSQKVIFAPTWSH